MPTELSLAQLVRRLLKGIVFDCSKTRANYPAWIEAIGAAKRYIHFESYIIHEDDTGWKFADALTRKAQEGVHVRLI